MGTVQMSELVGVLHNLLNAVAKSLLCVIQGHNWFEWWEDAGGGGDTRIKVNKVACSRCGAKP